MKALVHILGRRRLTGLALALVAMLVCGGAALATIPGGGGAISGCYAKRDGALRVIDASTAQCKSGETALTWNQSGPQGPSGETGPAGPQGPQGPPGPASSPGYQTTSSGVVAVHALASVTALATCPAGKRAIGGGFTKSSVEINGSEPYYLNGGWLVRATGPALFDGWVEAYAICANA